MTLQELVEAAGSVSWQHGFHENWNDGEKIALIHSEVSEALEELRMPNADPARTYYHSVHKEDSDTLLKPEGVPSEMADIVIRVADFCYHHKIDLGLAVREKLAFNKTRPFKHGKAF